MSPWFAVHLACRLLFLVVLLFSLSGCISALGDNLARSVLNNRDFETVRQGLPAYLLMLDGLIQDDPNDQQLLVSASSLYALDSTLETNDRTHRLNLAERGWQYSDRAVCARDGDLCGLWSMPFADFTEALSTLKEDDVPTLYSLGLAKMALMQADGGQFRALAELPRVEALFARLVALDEGYQQGGPQLYLGVLRLQRPPSMGGDPEQGRSHLERAIELSGGHNLEAKVELAGLYARMLYDRELHDRLLKEVLAADPSAEGLTLFNVLAQQDARRLLDSADDYFP